MKIIKLISENIKRLVAVEIEPSGAMVIIAGKNGAGKTSVLDSLWVALAGADTMKDQPVPIRRGQAEARIRLDMGELIVTRHFKRKADGGITTRLLVENADGARFPEPQTMLDALLSELCFDPLEFARMKPKAQFEALRQFVPGVDFDSIATAHKTDYDRRRDLNKFAEQEHAAASTILVLEGTPEAEIDLQTIETRLQEAIAGNAQIARRVENRRQVQSQINSHKALIDTLGERMSQAITKADEHRDRELSAQSEQRALIENQISRLQEQLALVDRRMERTRAERDSSIESAAKTLRDDDAAKRAWVEAAEARIREAGEIPAPTDTTAILEELAQARRTNEQVAKLDKRKAHKKRAAELEQQSQALTGAIEKRQADKRAAIAAAQMPVEGIGFGDEMVLLNGVPLSQASDAEQLQASTRIAMASNPKLRILRIRDGSLLDENSMQLLETMCEAEGWQCWIERVDSSGKVGFVIEDGMVKPHAETGSQEASA